MIGGDMDAFAQLYERYRSLTVSCASRKFPSHDLALDVSQETFHSELAGKTFTVLSAASDGINQDYYLLKIGSYMLCVIFTNGVYPAASGLTEYFSGAEAD